MENMKADCSRLMLNFRNRSAHEVRPVPTSGRYPRALRSQRWLGAGPPVPRQPLLVAPASTPLRPGKHRDLPHRPLL